MAFNNGISQLRESFFKVFQRVDISSENMRALPHDFVRNFSDDELSLGMKIGAQWGSSWDIGISKNPRFYYLDKSGWEKFVRDNDLGDNEFVTFTHIRKMYITVNIFNQNGKEMLQPPQSRASSSRVKTEQEEVMVTTTPAESSHRGATTAPAESNGRGQYKRKLNFGKKKAEDSSKRTEKVVTDKRYSPGASSSSVADIIIYIQKSYLRTLPLPRYVAKDLIPRERTMFIIHHPDKKRSWNVVYLPCAKNSWFSGGWTLVTKEYPIAIGDTCSFTFIKPNELILVVSKP